MRALGAERGGVDRAENVMNKEKKSNPRTETGLPVFSQVKNFLTHECNLLKEKKVYSEHKSWHMQGEVYLFRSYTL